METPLAFTALLTSSWGIAAKSTANALFLAQMMRTSSIGPFSLVNTVDAQVCMRGACNIY